MRNWVLAVETEGLTDPTSLDEIKARYRQHQSYQYEPAGDGTQWTLNLFALNEPEARHARDNVVPSLLKSGRDNWYAVVYQPPKTSHPGIVYPFFAPTEDGDESMPPLLVNWKGSQLVVEHPIPMVEIWKQVATEHGLREDELDIGEWIDHCEQFRFTEGPYLEGELGRNQGVSH